VRMGSEPIFLNNENYVSKFQTILKIDQDLDSGVLYKPLNYH
jgi:hypothetical protein